VTATTAHAFLAPSSAHRWVRCSAAPSLEAQFPDMGDKEAAALGTAAHWCMEILLDSRVVVVGTTAPNGVVVTREMIEAAEIIRDDVVETLGPSWFKLAEVEKRVDIPRVSPTHNWGTPDVKAWFTPYRLYLWDFKFGHDHVEVFENWQLIDYAAGCLSEANARRAAAGNPAINETEIEIVMRVAQPRSYHRDGPVREWKVTADQLRDHIHKLSMAADEATGPTPTAKPDPVACEHCSARHACVALQKAVYCGMGIVERAQACEMVPAALGLEARMLEDISQLIEARKTGLQEQILSLFRRGVAVPHWSLRPGQSRTVWNKPDAEIIALGQMMGVDLAKPAEAVTPVQSKAKGLDPEMAKMYSFTPQGALKLVPDDGSDARRVFDNP